ncbi:MAG: hypothetical protein B7Z66_11330 [Chromatiales bacterium 21-64-14]|nr:MAG: hypothetical protein B7Z66_11330 [Chromatiales bacterium 21-64-14]
MERVVQGEVLQRDPNPAVFLRNVRASADLGQTLGPGAGRASESGTRGGIAAYQDHQHLADPQYRASGIDYYA